MQVKQAFSHGRHASYGTLQAKGILPGKQGYKVTGMVKRGRPPEGDPFFSRLCVQHLCLRVSSCVAAHGSAYCTRGLGSGVDHASVHGNEPSHCMA